MVSGKYSSLSGAIAARLQLSVISNNLANINTPGFKKENVHFESMFREQLQTGMGKGTNFSNIMGTTTDFSQGSLTRTGADLDFGIDGQGFFKVAGEEGFKYTRSGNFKLLEDGSLVTLSGEQVIGENGPVNLPSSTVHVDSEGIARNEEGEEVGRLTVYVLPDPQGLEKRGNNLWVYRGQGRDEPLIGGMIRQGYLESSNVSAMRSMTNLIEVQRHFQGNQQSLKAYGDIAEKTNEIGQVS